MVGSGLQDKAFAACSLIYWRLLLQEGKPMSLIELNLASLEESVGEF